MVASITPSRQVPMGAWRWHPKNPDDDYELSRDARVVQCKFGIRIEQCTPAGVDVIYLNEHEAVALCRFLRKAL